MVQINFALREVNVKIVYYGPGRSGKTTNLEIIHAKAPKDSIGEMMSIATETDRTLFFDFLPLDLGKVAGMNTKFQLYTVPGQVYYKATRKLVLQGADGVVFVADSQADMMEENIQSLEDLEDNLRENGLDINTVPLVIQWNKRDLDNILSEEELNAKINRWNAPNNGAVAISGEGVFPTLKKLASTVIGKLNKEHGYGDAAGESPPPAPPPAAPAPTPAPAATPPAGGNTAASLVAELSQGAAPGTPATPAPPPAKPAAAAAPPPPPPPPAKPAAAAPPPPAAAPPPPPPAPAAPPPPASPAPKPAAPKPATPKPAAPKPTAPKEAAATPAAVEEGDSPSDKDGSHGENRIDTQDLNPVSREIRKRRELREKKQREQLERIKKSSRKPIRKEGPNPAILVVGGVILVAIAIIVYFAFFSG